MKLSALESNLWTNTFINSAFYPRPGGKAGRLCTGMKNLERLVTAVETGLHLLNGRDKR